MRKKQAISTIICDQCESSQQEQGDAPFYPPGWVGVEGYIYTLKSKQEFETKEGYGKVCHFCCFECLENYIKEKING
jgi:hypothetical protein